MREKTKIKITKEEREKPDNNRPKNWTIHYNDGKIVKKTCSWVQLLKTSVDNYIAKAISF